MRRCFPTSAAVAACGAAIALAVGGGTASAGAPVGIGHAGPTSHGAGCTGGERLRDEGVYALAISSAGKVCWEAALARPSENSADTFAPVADAGNVVLDSDGDLAAIDLADGRLRWSWSSGDTPVPTAGGGTQVVSVAGGRVIATGGPGEYGNVVGLDQSSGAVVWTRSVTASDDVPTPGPAGTLLLSGGSGDVTRVLVDRTGATLWTHPQRSSAELGGVPTAAGRVVIEQRGAGVQAIAARTGKLLWTHGRAVNDVQFAEGLVLLTPPPGEGLAHYDVPTSAVAPGTGRVLWSNPRFNPGGSSFYAAGGALLHAQAGGGPGVLERLAPATGKVLWRVATNAYDVVPADGGIIDLESTSYQGGAASIVARNLATGAVRWRSALPDAGDESVIDDPFFTVGRGPGAVVIDELGSDLIGVDAATGALRWHFALPGGENSIAPAGNRLVAEIVDARYVLEGH